MATPTSTVDQMAIFALAKRKSSMSERYFTCGILAIVAILALFMAVSSQPPLQE